MRTFSSSIIIVLAALAQLGSTDCGEVLRDSGFDLWCGDELCAWKIERGSIERVPTWNEGDSGVELVGPDVAIEQLSPVDFHNGTCIQFQLIANVETKAEVNLNVDVLGDGTIEHVERLPTAGWQPLSYLIRIRAPYAGVRFEITKTGSGRAMLANIGGKIAYSTDCAGITELDARPLPLGTPCLEDGDCASGLCGTSPVSTPFDGTVAVKTCIGCDANHPCSGSDVCGVTNPVSPVRAAPTECVPAGWRALGEQCSSGAECATGVCTYDTCSTCDDTGSCPADESCGPAWSVPFGVHSAWVCSPNQHRRLSGEPCATDDDCASSTCAGNVRQQCNDGRTCITAAQCPFGSGLKNGPCNTVGIEGGSCQ